MTKSMKSLMMGAALAGLMAGNTAIAQTPSSTSSAFSSGSDLGHMVSVRSWPSVLEPKPGRSSPDRTLVGGGDG